MHPLLARLPFIRRPFHQRDVARRERDRLLAEQGALIAERDALKLELQNARAAQPARVAQPDPHSVNAEDLEARGLPSAKIFCIGFGKTGTTSLEAFFRGLGFKLGDQAAGELLIREWAARNFEPIVALARTAQVFQDIPFGLPFTFVALDSAFPGAKFIHSVRDDAAQWYRSITRFHTNIGEKDRLPTADDLKEYPYRYKGWLFEAMQLIYGTPEQEPYDKARLTAAYEGHNRAIAEYFRHRPESLLTINAADARAAEKILHFLGMAYTGQTMPHLNRSD